MNRDIQILREVITKLVPLLTGKGLKVTQRGTQAFVQADPKTNKPVLVNIPSIPDNATDDFISAVSGFVDHEVGHVLFTDWAVYGGGGDVKKKFTPEGQALMHSHNIIEDTMIEREIVKTFPGSESNLYKLHKHFLEKITTPAIVSAKGDQKAEFNYLMVPMMRALSGQEQFQEFMDSNGHWKHPMIENLMMALSDEALVLLKKAKTTSETFEVAQEVHDILFHNKKKDGSPVTPPPPPPPQPKQKPSKSQDKPEKKAEAGDGDGERDHSDAEEGEAGESDDAGEAGDEADGDQAGAAAPKAAAPETTEADADDGAETSDEGDESDDGDEEADGAGAGDDAEDGSDESDESEEEDGAGGEADDEADEADEADGAGSGDDEEADDDGTDDGAGDEGDDESDEDGNGFAEDEEEYEDNEGHNSSSDEQAENGQGGGVGGDAGKSMFDLDPSTFKPLDLSAAISQEIQQMAQKAVGESAYSVFTKDEDEIRVLEVPDGAVPDEWVPALDEAVSGMVGPMQKDIERLMAAQSLSVRTAGHRSGRLHSPSLYRVTLNDPRVFQRKVEYNSKDTAVMLLVDNSGSMCGGRIVVAMQAAYALAQTLERIGISSEIIGFTTGALSRAAQQQVQDEYSKHGVQFDRSHHTVVMPIFKTFSERLNSAVKKRIAYQLNVQAGMNTNTDGESLEYAALRLIPRREKRKVMLVLSDGQPVGSGSGPHLKATVENLTRIGIETVGIGIQSDAVKNFYPRHVSLNNIADLPAVVMGELKRILTK